MGVNTRWFYVKVNMQRTTNSISVLEDGFENEYKDDTDIVILVEKLFPTYSHQAG